MRDEKLGATLACSGRGWRSSLISHPLSLICALSLALVVRSAALVVARQSLQADPDDYRRLAVNLAEYGTLGHGNLPSAYRPPLYPILLAALPLEGRWGQAAIAGFHLLLGLATVWLVYRLGQRCGLGRFALFAAMLVACDPILLRQSVVVMTETLATLLSVLCVTLLVGSIDWRFKFPGASPLAPLLAGLCLGLSALCRPTFLVFAVIAVAAAAWTSLVGKAWETARGDVTKGEGGRRKGEGGLWTPNLAAANPRGPAPRIGRALIMGGSLLMGLAIPLVPWMVRNYVALGSAVVATTHGGYTLLLGNNPQFYEYLRSGAWGSVWDAEELTRAQEHLSSSRPRNELDADQVLYRQAIQTIRNQPGMFAWSCLVRVGRLWSLLPHQLHEESPWQRAARWAVGLWYLIELPLAGWGLWVGLCRVPPGSARRSGGAWAWWAVLALSFTAVHALYWTDMRMRAPLMPGVALAASFGMARIQGWGKEVIMGALANR
jgi:hypothetical protein